MNPARVSEQDYRQLRPLPSKDLDAVLPGAGAAAPWQLANDLRAALRARQITPKDAEALLTEIRTRRGNDFFEHVLASIDEMTHSL